MLILRQPDLGTALLILIAGILMLWIAGIRTKFFVYACIFCACAAPLFWYCLKDYQKQRIRVFLGQGQSHKERYQIEQATIAIGSGGITGKGFLQGTKNKLRFLPEGRTDFIFAVICEELGFCGSMMVLLIYTILFIHFFNVIRIIKQPFIQLCAFGSSIHIVLSTIINIGMVLGLLPVVGIPLPFISAGVSNLWVNCISMGIFHSIVMRHNQFSD
jgi:rod shape determining protein RodA